MAHKSVGFDAGSSAWRVCVLDDARIIARERVQTSQVKSDPGILDQIVSKHADGLEAIAAPSGHGLPTTTIDKVGPRELRLITLKSGGDGIVGLASATEILKRTQSRLEVPCYVLPSVKHLPSVPRYRKINRIDMGTSDKVCSAACVLQTLSDRRSVPYRELSFVLTEIGHCFVSTLCVREGRIVDGIGGTMCGFGPGASGAIDAELVHAWTFPQKASLYTGGMVDAAGASLDEIEKSFAGDQVNAVGRALERLGESIASDALAVASRNGVKEVVVSSALGPRTTEFIGSAIEEVGLVVIDGPGGENHASTGAAYLANGIVGGRYRALVDRLRILESRGSIMEDIYFSGRPRWG